MRAKVMKEAMSVALALRNGRLSDLLQGNSKKIYLSASGAIFPLRSIIKHLIGR